MAVDSSDLERPPDLAQARELVKSGDFDALAMLYEDIPDTKGAGAVFNSSATAFLSRESVSIPFSESHCFICCTELGFSSSVSFCISRIWHRRGNL